MIKPVTYQKVLHTLEFAPDNFQDTLFRFEITTLANQLKNLTQDTRPISTLMQIIVEEFLGGEWDYKKYLCHRHRKSPSN